MNMRQGFPDTPNPSVQTGRVDTRDLDLLRIWQVLWRGRTMIAALGVVGVLLGAVYGYGIARPKFAATALLVMAPSNDPILAGDGAAQPMSQDMSDMNTQLHIIQSRGLVQRMVDALGLADDPEFNPSLRSGLSILSAPSARAPGADDGEATIQNVQQAISAQVQRNTRVVAVTARSEDRAKAADMANALSEIYLQDQIDAKFRAADDAVIWLSDRVADLRQDLSAREDMVARLKTRMDFTSVEGLANLNIRLKEARARLQDVRQRTDQVGLGQDGLTSGQQRLALQKSALEKSISELEQAVKSQSADINALQQLEREAQATRVLYETLLARLKEASAVRGLQQADARILTPASTGTYLSPKKGLIMLAGAILGMIAACLHVLTRHFVHAGFRTSDALENTTGIPVLGQVPIIPVTDRQALVPFLSTHPTAAAVEAIRNLRTSLLMSDTDHPPQVILMASAIPGEGKTTQAVALAHNLAGLGKRVLLIDGDIRRRTLGRYVTDAQTGGIISVLAGDVPFADAVQHVAGLGADVLLGGQTKSSAADLFASRRFAGLIAAARETYDMIVIDSPPVLVVPDARVIARHADAVLFTVAWNKTTRQQVIEGLRQFEMVNSTVTGLVLSQVNPDELARYGDVETNPAYSIFGAEYYGAA